MIVCTGDETGLVKLHSNLRKEVQTYGEQSRQKGVAALHSSSSSRQVSVLRKNGMLERYSMDGKSLEMELMNETFSSVMSPLGLVHLNYNSRSLVYNEEGSLATISEDNAVESFKISGPLSVITALNDGFAAGGKENDVKIFDAETRECVWAARNVPHDNLKLRVPVYVKDISFINHENYVASGGCFVTGTAYKQMRLYDTRVSSQPCSSTEIGDYCLTKVKVSSEGNSVFLGDTSGELFCYDLRTLKRIATLSSAAGSIRGLSLSESGRILLSVSLDRFFRAYDTITNKVLFEKYCNGRLNAGVILWEAAVKKSKTSAAASTKALAAGDRREDDSSGSGEGSEDAIEDFILSDDDEESDEESLDEEEEVRISEDRRGKASGGAKKIPRRN